MAVAPAGQVGVLDVRNRIPETIDVNDFTFDEVSSNLRFRPAQADELRLRATQLPDGNASAEVGGSRSENVTPMKGVADRAQKIFRIFQPVNRSDSLLRQRERQNTVVGPDKEVLCRLHRDAMPPAAHSGINDRKVNRAFREKAATGRQRKRPGADIAGRNLVSDVRDHGVRIEAEDHPFHRPDKPVLGSEIGGQRDDLHEADYTSRRGDCISELVGVPRLRGSRLKFRVYAVRVTPARVTA